MNGMKPLKKINEIPIYCRTGSGKHSGRALDTSLRCGEVQGN
jgi:hypothetical protein